MNTHIYTYIYINIYINICTNIYIYIYMYIYTNNSNAVVPKVCSGDSWRSVDTFL